MHPDLHMGFEMLPGSADPALAEWGAGALSRADFLEQVEWGRVWGMDPDLYMPLFNLVRIHQIPAFGMNVPRKQISRVAELGWDAAETVRQTETVSLSPCNQTATVRESNRRKKRIKMFACQ